MVAVDTNVVIRLLTNDEPEQNWRSEQLFRTSEVFIPDTVILESAWVLSEAYGFNRHQIVTGLKKLFGLPNVHLRDASAIDLTLEWYANGIDFADAIHLAQTAHCQQLLTFDRRFANRAKHIATFPVKLISVN